MKWSAECAEEIVEKGVEVAKDRDGRLWKTVHQRSSACANKKHGSIPAPAILSLGQHVLAPRSEQRHKIWNTCSAEAPKARLIASSAASEAPLVEGIVNQTAKEKTADRERATVGPQCRLLYNRPCVQR